MVKIVDKKRFDECVERLKKYLATRTRPGQKGHYRRIDDLALLENYFEVKQILGRVPLGIELPKYGRFHTSAYNAHFGSYFKFLEIIGEEKPPTRPVPPPAPAPVTTIELIAEFRRVMKELGRTPTWEDLGRRSKFETDEYRKIFRDTNTLASYLNQNPDMIERLLAERPTTTPRDQRLPR